MVATRRSAPRRPQSYDRALLTVAEMGRADRMTIDAGTPGERLMERAGEGVAAAICRRWAPRPVAVLCGPGNNGGDGFVVGRRLAGAGWDVRLGLLGRRASLRGDAALNAGRWTCPVVELADAVAAQRLIAGTGLIVDALFGAGLVRPLDGLARDTVEAMDRSGVPVVAVDVPSGVDGDTGLVRGAAPRATLTVTFFRPKPGHYLLPGRTLCGELEVVDIGISATVLETVGATIFLNDPSLWAERFPWPTIDTHKYARGHAVIRGGATMTGAARLAALAARRIGAGLVTVAAPSASLPIYASDQPGTLVWPLSKADDFRAAMADYRRNAVLVGPGNGADAATVDAVRAALAIGRAAVLDADALTVMAGRAGELAARSGGALVLTPHDGEFARLFDLGDRSAGKLARTRGAAALSQAVVLFKGADTVIAAPDGTAVVNANAPPELATAGSGDVLAGLIVGLLAQGMPAFQSAAAAAWLHGDIAQEFGAGLIAEDLVAGLPAALKRLKSSPYRWP